MVEVCAAPAFSWRGLTLPDATSNKSDLAAGDWRSPAPSGSGYQTSMFGCVGLLLALEEGL